MEEQYIGTTRAAEILNVKQSTVSQWCREEKFKTARQDGKGSPWMISENEVYQLAEKRKKEKQ